MASNSSTYYLDRRNRKKKRKSSKMEDEYDSKKSRLDLDLSHNPCGTSFTGQSDPQTFHPELNTRPTVQRIPLRRDSQCSVHVVNGPSDQKHLKHSYHRHPHHTSTESSTTNNSNSITRSDNGNSTEQSDLTLDVLFQMEGTLPTSLKSDSGHTGETSSCTSVSSQTVQTPNHEAISHTTVIDDLFEVDRSGDAPPPNDVEEEEPSGTVTYIVDGGNTEEEVIVVESEDEEGEDEEEDVVVLHESRVDPDELMARRLRAQFEQESLHNLETFGSAVSTRSMTSDETSRGSELIRDNMEALATRIDTWTMADARRFLMVTLPPNRRGAGRINRQSVERHLTRTHPMLLYAAIMGGPSVFPSGLSSMGSYEDLLELAEQLGPARSSGMSDEAIDLLPTKSYVRVDNVDDPSKQSCVVCMSEYHKNDTLTTLPCLHDFHSSCIKPWLKTQKTCPICRNEVTPNA